MDLCAAGVYMAIFILIFIILGIVTVFITSTKPNMERYESEKYFLTTEGSTQAFPSIHDPPTLDLSVIVPSYNEEERLPKMLDEAVEYLENRKKNTNLSYEVIVVDDGSKDKTSEVALEYSKKYGSEKVRVLTQVKNRGKGGAIRLGMFSARGRNLLFADADGATQFSDVSKLEAEMKKITADTESFAVVCGSRAHLEKESVAERSFFRTILMYGFHFLVWFLCVRGVKDTQCGFKLLTRPAAIVLFSNLHVDRWAFDVDMLYIAQYLHMHISEVGVTWHEIEGSKMVPVWSWLQMGRDLLLIRLRYMIGAWTISAKPKTS